MKNNQSNYKIRINVISTLTQARRQKEKEALKKKIIDNAKVLLRNSGIGSITMRKLAMSVKYSLPVIYTYFKDKAEILALLDQEIKLKYPDYESAIKALKAI